MKCEICHRAEAVTAVTAKVDGVEKELYVCADCAAAAKPGASRRKRTAPSGRQPKVTIVGKGAEDVPQPLVEEFVKATLGFMKGMADSEQEDPDRTCASCKTRWSTVKESGRLGCPSCWKAFSREIRETFLSAEYGAAHVGAAPAVEALPDPKAARRVLERELKDAVAREDYRRAAELKRRLDALDDGEERA